MELSGCLSISIAEIVNSEILWTWFFPCSGQNERNHITATCPTLNGPFYGQFNQKWFYLSPNIKSKEENVDSVAVVVWTRDYRPGFYLELARVSCRIYSESSDPTKVLEFYLDVFTKGINAKSPVYKDFVSRPILDSNITDLFKLFGLEMIVIYNAVLLKRRIVLYHHSVQYLLEVFKTVPTLVPHRKSTESFFPSTDLAFLENIKSESYVAGTTDDLILSRPELFDVLVNLSAKEITVAQQAKEKLPMTKAHKDIALTLQQLVVEGKDEFELMEVLTGRTEALLHHIKAMFTTNEHGIDVLSMSQVKEKNLSATMESFVVQLAEAEEIQVK